jgi:transcriptional regulator with XRE-family HTH domain
MNGKTAYQCIECKKPLSHATGVNIALTGKPVLIHRSRCLTLFNTRQKKAAKAGFREAKERAAAGAVSAIMGIVEAPPQAVIPLVPDPPPPVLAVEESPAATQEPTPSEKPQAPIPTSQTHFGQLVRQYRAAQGLSMRALAQKLDLGSAGGTWIWVVETKRPQRITPRFERLGALLGLSYQELQQSLARGPKLGTNLAPDGIPAAWKQPTVVQSSPRDQIKKVVRSALEDDKLMGFQVEELGALLAIGWKK